MQYYFIYPDFFSYIQAQIARSMIDYNKFHKNNRPAPLLPVDVFVLPVNSDTYDIVAVLQNTNDKWYIPEVTYQFIHDGGETEKQKTYVLPLQERYILELGIQSETPIKSAQLYISDIKWQRLSHEGIWDYESFRDERNKIFIVGETFFSSRDLDLGAAVPVSRTRFSAVNESNFNFWNVGYVLLLMQNNKVIAANYLNSGVLLADSIKSYETSWFQRLPSYLDFKVIPDVNILDPGVYMDFQSGAGPRK